MEIKNSEFRDLIQKNHEYRLKTDVSSEDIYFLTDIAHLLEEDRKNRIIESVLQKDSRIQSLFHKIEEEIEYYQRSLGYYQQSKYYRDFAQNMIEKLQELRERILSFMKDQQITTKEDEENILKKAFFVLGYGYCDTPKFFGKTLVDKKNDQMTIQEEPIHRLYALLENKEYMEQLMKGVSLCEREKYYQERISICEESLSYQASMKANFLKVKQYASLHHFLGKLKADTKDERYYRIDQRIEETSKTIDIMQKNLLKRFISHELLLSLIEEKEELGSVKRILDSLNENIQACEEELERMREALRKTPLAPIVDSLENEDFHRPDFSIEKGFLTIFSMDDFDAFYRLVEKEKANDEAQLQQIQMEKDEFFSSSESVKELLEQDYETALHISSLYTNYMENEVSPELVIYGLKVFASRKDASQYEKEFSEEEVQTVKDFLEDEVQTQTEEFQQELRQMQLRERAVQYYK